MATEPLQGRCPACGAEELYRGFQGRITCGNTLCENQSAIDTLLTDPELLGHLVEIIDQDGRRGWTLRHPLIERLHDALFGCDLAAWLVEDGPPFRLEPGVYRATAAEDGLWQYEPVDHA